MFATMFATPSPGEKRTVTTRALAAFPTIFLLGSIALAQNDSQGAVELSRVNFETHFNYAPRSIGKAVIPCMAGDWTVAADWGDATGPEALSHVVGGESKTIPGSYLLYTRHRYDRAGSYTATTTLSVKCANGTRITKRQQALINVFDHVGIKTFSSDRTTYAAGDSILLSFVLLGPAPPSGTELFLAADASGANFSSQTFPVLLVVPPGLDRARAEIRTKISAKDVSITLTAISATGQQHVTVHLE